MQSIFRHIKAWLRRGRLDEELREELAQHVEWKTDSLIADGVPEREARRRAAVFSLADRMLFRKLPGIADPDALVLLEWASGPVFPFSSLNGNGRQNAE